ncbi:MAG: hypothetical protein ACI35S_01490, partial [Anaeroplasma sp.]
MTIISGLIIWIPTIIFLIFLILGFLFGLWRGLRKSLILAIQALAAFLICLILYFVIVKNAQTDYYVVSIANNLMGENYLQSLFGVSNDAQSFKEILIEFIPKNMDYGEGLALVVKDNGAYLGSLVNLVYHIVFAIICAILYLVLIFVLYIIYLIFYPERRHKAKYRAKFLSNKTSKPYKKRALFGGIIGMSRGLISGFVCLSFIGTLFFIISGGISDKKDNQSIDIDNNYYSIYNSISDYGSNGIFKILNTIKNKDDIPYYVYVADIVFQGEYKDPETGLEANIVLSRELGAYTKFARQTFNLVLKYDDEKIINRIILGNENLNIMDEIVKIIGKEEFQNEFSVLIDEFNAGTYFINFGLSLVDSIINHIDELSLNFNDDILEPIKIMFKKGYKSPYIPEDLNNDNPACINASALLTETDAKNLVKAVISILSIEKVEDTTKTILTYSEQIIPAISNLSILSNERKEQINPVLERMYSYIANKYLNSIGNSDDNSEEISISYMANIVEKNNQTIDWVKEINSLLDLSYNAITLANNAYSEVPKDDNEENSESKNMTSIIVDILFDIFDESKENYNENVTAYNEIKNDLSNSSLLSLVMSETNAYKILEQSLIGLIPQIYLSPNISYMNVLDENGNVIEYGEVYNLLTTLQCLLENDSTKDVVNILLDSNNLDSYTMLTTIKSLTNLLNYYDGDNKQVIDYLLESKIISSILSGFIFSYRNIDAGSFEISIYIPDNMIVIENGVKVNLIENSSLKQLFVEIPSLIDVLTPFLDENDTTNYNNINSLFSRLTYNDGNGSLLEKILTSKIVEGTLINIVSSILLQQDLKEYFVIPSQLLKADGDINVEAWIEINELFNIVNAVATLDISFEDTSSILNSVLSINESTQNPEYPEETRLDVIYLSEVIKASLTHMISSSNSDSIISIPNDAYELSLLGNQVVSKNEIGKMIESINALQIDLNNMDFTYIALNNDVVSSVSSSKIIRSTMTNMLSTDELKASLIIPDAVKEGAGYISEAEMTNLLTSLVENKNDLFLEFDPNNVEKVKISSVNVDGITVNVLNNIMDRPDDKQSIILNSTVIVQLASVAGTSGLIMPSDYVTGASIKADDENESIISDYYNNIWIVNNEMIKLLEVLNVLLPSEMLDKTITNISQEDLTDDLSSLNSIVSGTDTKLDICYNSVIMKATMTKYLDETMRIMSIESEFYNSDAIKIYDLNHSGNDEYLFYIKDEVSELITSVNTLELNLKEFDTEDIKTNIFNMSEENINVVNSSKIVKYAIGKELDKVLTEITNKDVLDYSHENIVVVNEQEYKGYKSESIYCMINSIKDGLGITNLNNLNSFDYNDISNMDIRKLYEYNSYIVLNIMSEKLNTILNNNSVIVNHNRALYKPEVFSSSDAKFYRENELLALQLIGGNSIDSFDIGNIDLGNTDEISKSFIVNATITNHLSKLSNLILPDNNYDSEEKLIVDTNEFKLLLDAIDSIPGVNMSNFEFDSIKPSSISNPDVLSRSFIMRTNISCKIDSSGKDEIYMNSNKVFEHKVAYYSSSSSGFVLEEGKYQYVIVEEEITNIFNSLMILSPNSFDVSIDISSLINLLSIEENGVAKTDAKNLDIILNSEFMRILISEYLLSLTLG